MVKVCIVLELANCGMSDMRWTTKDWDSIRWCNCLTNFASVYIHLKIATITQIGWIFEGEPRIGWRHLLAHMHTQQLDLVLCHFSYLSVTLSFKHVFQVERSHIPSVAIIWTSKHQQGQGLQLHSWRVSAPRRGVCSVDLSPFRILHKGLSTIQEGCFIEVLASHLEEFSAESCTEA